MNSFINQESIVSFLRLKGIQVKAFFKGRDSSELVLFGTGLSYLILTLVLFFGDFDTLEYLSGRVDSDFHIMIPFTLAISATFFCVFIARIHWKKDMKDQEIHFQQAWAYQQAGFREVEELLSSGRVQTALQTSRTFQLPSRNLV